MGLGTKIDNALGNQTKAKVWRRPSPPVAEPDDDASEQGDSSEADDLRKRETCDQNEVAETGEESERIGPPFTETEGHLGTRTGTRGMSGDLASYGNPPRGPSNQRERSRGSGFDHDGAGSYPYCRRPRSLERDLYSDSISDAPEQRYGRGAPFYPNSSAAFAGDPRFLSDARHRLLEGYSDIGFLDEPVFGPGRNDLDRLDGPIMGDDYTSVERKGASLGRSRDPFALGRHSRSGQHHGLPSRSSNSIPYSDFDTSGHLYGRDTRCPYQNSMDLDDLEPYSPTLDESNVPPHLHRNVGLANGFSANSMTSALTEISGAVNQPLDYLTARRRHSSGPSTPHELDAHYYDRAPTDVEPINSTTFPVTRSANVPGFRITSVASPISLDSSRLNLPLARSERQVSELRRLLLTRLIKMAKWGGGNGLVRVEIHPGHSPGSGLIARGVAVVLAPVVRKRPNPVL